MSERTTAFSTGQVTRRRFLGASLAFGAGTSASAALLDPHAEAARPRAWQGSQRVPKTVRQKVGQLFVVSFSGTTPSASFHSLLQRHAFGGVVLFGRNAVSAAQLRALLSDVQRAAPFPLLVCTDQEGGIVVRIRNGAPVFPSEASYEVAGSQRHVGRDAAATARALRSLGLTMNLAPVVDVLKNPASPIGSRSYGTDPHLVARLSVAAIHGYQDHGLAATAKHFLGLGHTSVDSHLALPTVTQRLDQLEQADLIPFRAAIAAGVSSVLVAHVALPAIDPVYRPASLSPVVIGGLLRRRLGFRGVVMTDSLLMGAVPHGKEAEAAERAVIAGADVLLLGWDRDIPSGLIDEAVERVVTAVQRRRIPESRLDEAVGRIAALKARYPLVRVRQD